MEHSDKLIWELARRHLEKTVSDKSALECMKGLSFTGVQEDTAFFVYSGTREIEPYIEMLEEGISWAAGKKIKVRVQRKSLSKRKKAGRKGGFQAVLTGALSIIVLFAAVLLAGKLFWGNSDFEKGFYSLSSNKINGNVRIVQLSDLGGASFGPDNNRLRESVALLQPDIIVFSGNMAGSAQEQTVSLCQDFSEIAEVYYVFGEGEAALEENYREELEAVGVHVLTDEAASVSVDGNIIDLYGIGPENGSVEAVQEQETFQEFQEQSPGHFKVVISSSPYMYSESFFENSPDLLLSGGTLGGGIRLPYFGVLKEKRYGFFPEWKKNSYIYGKYYIGTTPLIVSRGLTDKGVVRFNNQPELVIVDLSRY